MLKYRGAVVVVLAVMGTVGLAGCSNQAAAEAEFVADVREQLDTKMTDADLVDRATEACDLVRNGASKMDILGVYMGSDMTPADFGLMMGVGVSHLCPDLYDEFVKVIG